MKNYFVIALLLLSGCATPSQHQALRKVQIGMDKADVLELVGGPAHTNRIHGQDRWTYEADSQSGKEITYIFLREGKVTLITKSESAEEASDNSKAAPTNKNFKPVDN